mgnify:CR=1 FL=1
MEVLILYVDCLTSVHSDLTVEQDMSLPGFVLTWIETALFCPDPRDGHPVGNSGSG